MKSTETPDKATELPEPLLYELIVQAGPVAVNCEQSMTKSNLTTARMFLVSFVSCREFPDKAMLTLPLAQGEVLSGW
jgi:hypothetical protein